MTEPSEPLVVPRATVPPEVGTLLPSASFSWTVIVEVELPFAVIEPGAALIVEVAVEAAPALIVVAGLVLAVLEPSLMSVAVKVALPAVLAVTAKVLVPATRAALPGSVAAPSELVMAAVSVTVLTVFQLASTALTVTLKLVPAV